MRICTYNNIDEVGVGRWDELVASCGAPIFYRSTFLRAFELFPLHDVKAHYYLIGENENGSLIFATPVYLLKGVDPMRVINDHFPDFNGASILVNHVWHCYDTWILARHLDADVVGVVLQNMKMLAEELGVALWGFTNVDGTGALNQALTAAGMTGVLVDERFLIDLTSVPDIDSYLARLKSDVRQNLRRYRHIAEREGIVNSIKDVQQADLEGFVKLARAGAAKYGNADYYQPGIFEAFVRAMGKHAIVLEQRLDGKLIGSAILLDEESTLHWWVAGNDYTALPQISPFYLAFLGILEEALTSGKSVLEAGRRNPRFKTRHGLSPRPVLAYFEPTLKHTVDI
ncbi:GNAT family N-acetyltransferase [Buttiauxella noackiae]|uniref:GNAT family N-acetyltransferase n=1 Tax=Buttiauxella noackiae TaxID=82992 RepID=UPI0035A71F04